MVLTLAYTKIGSAKEGLNVLRVHNISLQYLKSNIGFMVYVPRIKVSKSYKGL